MGLVCLFQITCFRLFLLTLPDIFHVFLLKVATGIANLSDLRSIHGALVTYKNILLRLYDSHFGSNLRVIDHLLMEDFSQLDNLYTELDTAVGQLISDYSVMEGYSNTADEVKEKLGQNSREVEELRDLYRFVTVTRCACTMLVFVCFTASQFVRNY